jgi:hypothetical protein
VVDAVGHGEHTVGPEAYIPLSEPGFAWSPKANLIAFERAPHELLVAPTDGAGKAMVVSRIDSTYVTPAWRPAVALYAADRRPCPRR